MSSWRYGLAGVFLLGSMLTPINDFTEKWSHLPNFVAEFIIAQIVPAESQLVAES
jgi:hypothetical protein